MKIGLFDSGVGGLTIEKEISAVLPAYDSMYLGDSQRSPYGNKSQEEIYEFTKQAVTWLFSQGAGLVILACNTASSQALRKLQQEWLSQAFGDRKLLGIIVPIAKEAALRSKGLIGVVGTNATVSSQTYIKELRKIRPELKIIQVALPELTAMIEINAPLEEIKTLLTMYVSPLKEAGVDTLLLGCSHYPLIVPLFQEAVGESVYIPDTGKIVAKKLEEYLEAHPEIDHTLTQNGERTFFTTGDAIAFSTLSQRFLGTTITAKTISL